LDPVFQSFLSGFPVMLIHFLITLTMFALAVTIYLFITPYHEMTLIRAGNTAAAVSLSGAMIGLALPLAFCMASSVSYWDIAIWGCVALAIQLLTYRIADLLLKGLPQRVEKNEIGPAILVASIKLAVAIINAAAVA
jgi:putative membrane protein